MSVDKKRDKAFSGLVTNLDGKMIDDATRARLEQEERQTAWINKAHDDAARDEREGTVQPQVIYSGMSEAGKYTADPNFDKSREAIVNQKWIRPKQYEITPEGDFVTVYDEDSAALSLLQDKTACAVCGDRQPEMPELWHEAARRLAERIGPPPSGLDFRPGEYCCYCASKLGFEQTYVAEKPSITQVTPDQRQILETMFGSVTGAEAGPGIAPSSVPPISGAAL